MLISPSIAGEQADAGADVSASGSPQPPCVLTDGQLVQRYLRRGDEEAFSQLVSRFGPLVYAVALRTVGDSHVAEDVFQGTFLVLARDAAKVRNPSAIGGWLHGTATKIAKRALARRRKKEVHMADLTPASNGISLLDEISKQFEQQLVDEELQRLPAHYRSPLVLHFLEGKSCEETAAALGTTTGAVRGRLQRGKRELQLRLMRRGIEFSTVMAAVAYCQSAAVAAVHPPLITAAIGGGMAVAKSISLPSTCSPEAVHLAAKETTMLTTGNILAGSVALLITAAGSWFAHAAIGGSETPDNPALLSASFEVQREIFEEKNMRLDTETLQGGEILAFAEADESDSKNEDDDGKPQTLLKYGDDKADGKRSIAGTGEMIRFKLPDTSQKLRNLRVHCARYGTTKPPNENAEFTIVSEDGSEVIHTELVPYSTFQRGESRWTTIRFKEPVDVPETFWAILQFNAERTKGVYVSFDTSTGGEHSRIGLPGKEMNEVNTGGDWMVQAVLTKPK